MPWQDVVITICILAFSYALLPEVWKNFKTKKGSINLQTTGITATGMYVLAITYFTLNLYFSMIVSVLTGTLWAILFFQKIIYK